MLTSAAYPKARCRQEPESPQPRTQALLSDWRTVIAHYLEISYLLACDLLHVREVGSFTHLHLQQLQTSSPRQLQKRMGLGTRQLRRIRSRPSIPHRTSTVRNKHSPAFHVNSALSLKKGDMKGDAANRGGSDRFLCHSQHHRVRPSASRPRVHVLLPPLSGSRTGDGSPQITPPLMQLQLPLASRHVSFSKSRISKIRKRCMWRLMKHFSYRSGATCAAASLGKESICSGTSNAKQLCPCLNKSFNNVRCLHCTYHPAPDPKH